MFSQAFLLASLSATALALPNITAKLLPAGCSSYPLYDPSTDNAGPWSLSATNSDNPALEGFGVSNVYSVSYSPSTGPVMRWGYVRPLPSPSPLPPTNLYTRNCCGLI